MHCFAVIAVLATIVVFQAFAEDDPHFKFTNFMECGNWGKGLSDNSKVTQYPRLCLNWCYSQGTEYVWVARNDETGECRCLKKADCNPQLKEWNSLYLSRTLRFETLFPKLPTYEKCFPNVSC